MLLIIEIVFFIFSFASSSYTLSTFSEEEILQTEDEVDFSLDPPPVMMSNIHEDKISYGYIISTLNSHVTLETIDFTINGIGVEYRKAQGLNDRFAFAYSIGGNAISNPDTKNRLVGFGLPLEGNFILETWEQKHPRNSGHSIPIFFGLKENLYAVFLMVPRVVTTDSALPAPPHTIGFKGNKLSAQAGITPSFNLFDAVTFIPYYDFEQTILTSIVPFRSERSALIFNRDIRTHTFGLKLSFPSENWAQGLYFDFKYDKHDTPGETQGEIRTIMISLGWFFGKPEPVEKSNENIENL